MADDVTRGAAKGAQVRLRASATEKEHLEQAAIDAGFKKKDGSPNLSEYLRVVLLERTVVAVPQPGGDLFLIPAFTGTPEARRYVEELLERMAAWLNAEVPSSSPAPTSQPPGPAAGGEGANDGTMPPSPAAPAAPDTPPSEQGLDVAGQELSRFERSFETSPAEDAVVGTGASRTPPGELPPAPPPAQEFCSNCGAYYPTGQHIANGETCARARAVRLQAGQGSPEQAQANTEAVQAAVEGEVSDARDLRPDELEPEANPPLGPPQPGEDEALFLIRRAAELQRDGRPPTIARAEAGAEWRRALVGDGPLPTQTPRRCLGCGATVTTSPCPQCGTP